LYCIRQLQTKAPSLGLDLILVNVISSKPETATAATPDTFGCARVVLNSEVFVIAL